MGAKRDIKKRQECSSGGQTKQKLDYPAYKETRCICIYKYRRAKQKLYYLACKDYPAYKESEMHNKRTRSAY